MGVRELTDRKLHKAKIVEVDDKQQLVRVQYVGWNSRYDEVVPLSSLRVRE